MIGVSRSCDREQKNMKQMQKTTCKILRGHCGQAMSRAAAGSTVDFVFLNMYSFAVRGVISKLHVALQIRCNIDGLSTHNCTPQQTAQNCHSFRYACFSSFRDFLSSNSPVAASLLASRLQFVLLLNRPRVSHA